MSFHESLILVYHHIPKKKDGKSYSITVADYNKHLRYLYQNDFECAVIDDYMESVKVPLDESRKKIFITFDDGHESDFNIVLPLLKKYNFRATFFVTTDWIGTNGYLNREQLQKLKDAGMSIQSHAKTHKFIDEMDEKGVFEEISYSKYILEKILDCEVSSLSFPGGRYSKYAVSCAKKAGFKTLFTSDPYYLREVNGVTLIGRCMVKYTPHGDNFMRLVTMSQCGRIKLVSYNYGKKILRKLLGNHLYHNMWKKFSHDVYEP